MADQLKACAHCGGVAKLYDPDGTYFVACTSCYAAVGENYDRDSMPDHHFCSSELAIAAWNTRANTPASSAAQGAMAVYPIQYLLTDAEHLANSACILLDYLNDRSDDEEGIIKPDDHFSDYTGAIRNAVHEFRKRHARYVDSIAAQPSDATAQPRVDLTDEQIIKTWDKWQEIPTQENGEVIGFARELLANTAQDRPEHPECSGDSSSCQENEGHGCYKPNPARCSHDFQTIIVQPEYVQCTKCGNVRSQMAAGRC